MKKLVKTYSVIGAIFLSTALSGCMTILPDPQPSKVIYRLPTSDHSWTNLPGAYAIRIERPLGAHFFMGKDIAASPDGHRYKVLAGSEWIEELPVLIQVAMQDMINAQPDMVGILPITGTRSDYRISLTIHDFEARFDQGETKPPLIIIKYSATMADASTRNFLGSYEVRKTRRAPAASVSSVVDTMGKTNEDALGELIDWMGSIGLQAKRSAVAG